MIKLQYGEIANFVLTYFKCQDEKVQKILCDVKLLQRKVGMEIAKKVKQRMNQLEATENFNQYLTQIGLGKPHPLTGNLDNCYGIAITANYRLVVEPLETKLDMESLKNCKILNVKGVLEYHDRKQEELAIRTGFSPKHISEVVNEKKGISPSFAKSLEYVFGIPTSFWINLQGIYYKELLDYKERAEIDENEVEVVKQLKGVVKYAEKLNLIEKQKMIYLK